MRKGLLSLDCERERHRPVRYCAVCMMYLNLVRSAIDLKQKSQLCLHHVKVPSSRLANR